MTKKLTIHHVTVSRTRQDLDLLNDEGKVARTHLHVTQSARLREVH